MNLSLGWMEKFLEFELLVHACWQSADGGQLVNTFILPYMLIKLGRYAHSRGYPDHVIRAHRHIWEMQGGHSGRTYLLDHY